MKKEAIQLIVPKRFDLIAKYLYACSFIHKELYIRHIEALSGGNFREPGQPWKNSCKKYIESFNALIVSIYEHGFDETISTVPLSENGVILDGAHRVAVGATLDTTIDCVYAVGECNFNSFFFRKQYLKKRMLEYMAIKYTEIKSEKLILMFVPQKKLKKFECLLSDNKNVECVYQCKIEINKKLQDNINLMLKMNHITGQDNICANKRGKVYLLESYEEDNLSKMCECSSFFSDTADGIKIYTKCFFDFNTYNLLSSLNPQKLLNIIKNINYQQKEIRINKYMNCIYLGNKCCHCKELMNVCKPEIIKSYFTKKMLFRELENIFTFFGRVTRNIRTKIRDFLQDRNVFFATKLWHWINGKGYI